MKNREAVQIELLGEGHLPAALRLTEQSQWNQTERDWRRLLQFSPGGGFGVFRPAVCAFDRLAFGADRSCLLASLIADSPVAPLVAMTPEGQLEGFALARPGRRAFYIGPVAARGRETALVLLDGMLGQLAGEKVYLDFNIGFGLSPEVLAERELVKQRDLTQMAFGPESRAGISKRIFGLTGPEMG